LVSEPPIVYNVTPNYSSRVAYRRGGRSVVLASKTDGPSRRLGFRCPARAALNPFPLPLPHPRKRKLAHRPSQLTKLAEVRSQFMFDLSFSVVRVKSRFLG